MAGAIFGEVQLSLFSWQAQYLVKFNRHFSWRARYLVKFGMSAKRSIFQYKMRVVSAKSNLSCAAGCGLTGSCSDHARIILGPCSGHARIGPALYMTFQPFSENFSDILECHFSWQAQYLVMLEGDSCCSAHCTGCFICDEDQSW